LCRISRGSRRPARQFRREYVDLVINEMLPRVAKEKSAEFAMYFASAVISDVEQSRKILSARKSWTQTAWPCDQFDEKKFRAGAN